MATLISLDEIAYVIKRGLQADRVIYSMSYEDNAMNFRVFFKSSDLVIKLTDLELDRAQSVDELLDMMRNKLREELLNPKYWRVNAEDILWMVKRFQSTTGIDPDYEVKSKLRAGKKKGPMYEDIEPIDKFDRSEDFDRRWEDPHEFVGAYRG